jgi:hypothetical protein
MQDPANDTLVERFLNREIAATDFTHEMHVRVGWALLHRMPYHEALARIAATIKFMAEREGHPQKFNTTITAAFLALIAEHVAEHKEASWQDFIAANPALTDKQVLTRWYPIERLHSPAARETFLMPAPHVP